jgi:hypothetical protein
VKAVAGWALVLLAAVLAAASLIPLIPTEWWAIRLLDFPRLQLAAALIAAGIGLLFFLRAIPRGCYGPAAAPVSEGCSPVTPIRLMSAMKSGRWSPPT